MASPLSSSTTPSPPMSYISPVTQPGSVPDSIDDAERAERQRAVQKFLARAEVSKLARGLRTRLSYATYKATHNVPTVPFRDLEASARLDPVAAARAGRGINYYDNPNLQGRILVANAQAQVESNLRRGSMAPPAAIPAGAGRAQPPQPGKDAPAGANAAQSLYTSILAQPPPRRVRPELEPAEAALVASSRRDAHAPANGNSGSNEAPRPGGPTYMYSPTKRSQRENADGALTSVAERTRGQSRQSHASTSDRAKPASSSSGVKRKAASTRTREKASKRRKTDDASLADMDMKAAATLTDLLRSSRSGMNPGAASPRSTLSAGSDVGSASGSFSYAQSSARTQPPPLPAGAMSPAGSFSGTQPTTPPRVEARPLTRANNTLLSANSSTASMPADQEAIRLLQFLHESPSPARSTREVHDTATYRSLGPTSSQGSNASASSADLHATGRVLFPTGSGSQPPSRALSAANSFASTASAESTSPRHEPTIRIDPPPMRALSPSPRGPTTKVTPPTPTDERESQERPVGSYAFPGVASLIRGQSVHV